MGLAVAAVKPVQRFPSFVRADNPPAIAPLPASDRARPLLSVMIPAYAPGEFLVETLRSVLAQDLGAQSMQIAVVDDASPSTDIEALVAAVAPAGRVEIHRNATNLGLAGNWNRSIVLARGELVHLLHQDDVIFPGFYGRLLAGFASGAGTGMAFCRHAFVDEAGTWTRRSHLERWQPGILGGWLRKIGSRQRIQCPAAIVRRSVYERLGGFRNDLVFALDWEMWVRIAASYAVWYEPGILACYRRHPGSETTRLAAAHKVGMDTLQAIEIFSSHFPARSRNRLRFRAYRRLFRVHLRNARKLLENGTGSGALEQLEIARIALALLPDGLEKRLRKWQLRQHQQRCTANG